VETENESTRESRRFSAACGHAIELSRPIFPERLDIDDERRRSRLSSVIELEIIPRLHTFHHTLRSGVTDIAPSLDDLHEFGRIIMHSDTASILEFVGKMRSRGHSLDSICLNLFQPTARHLGELWEQDQCDFVDVTIGVAQLQRLMTTFESEDTGVHIEADHQILLAAHPEEQHVFGLLMVAKFMRAAGWETSFCQGLTVGDCCKEAAAEWFDVLGITVSRDVNIAKVANMIERIRTVSMNQAIAIIAGGAAFERDPELATRIGADAVAPDAPTAVILAKKLSLSTKKDRRVARNGI
jgi:MerR family transcriptional regulator, light-induced transcriptional regulator